MALPKSQAKYFRKELVKELRRVEKLIKNESSFEKKIYYFSAAHGITDRTIKYSFSKDVLITDFVLDTVHQLLLARLNQIKKGDKIIPLEEKHFEKICEGLNLLADRLESEESILEPLEIILTTVFSTTGPGNYLLEKGMFEL